MILRTGNMFDHIDECDVLLVTTNCIVKSNGELVMGSGAALQAKKYNPAIAKKFADVRLSKGKGAKYGLIILDDEKIGAFQTKYHYRGKARLDIITYSRVLLYDWAKQHKDKIVFLNYPGIGLGQLDEKEVLKIISRLPDNVVIWRLQ